MWATTAKQQILTEAEHVSRVAERLVKKHLWRHVLVCATDGHFAVARHLS